MKIAVIGAGPAGLTIAHQLSKYNIAVDVYDNEARVGGFAKSIELWDRKIEIGPHFLNVGIAPQVNDLVLQVLDGEYSIYQRRTFIITNDKMFYYPPVITDIVKKLGINEICMAAGSLLKQTVQKKEAGSTAETFVKQRLGSHLYQYFFENFSKKLWGLDGNKVSDVFAKSLLGFNNGYTPIKIIYTKLKQSFKGPIKQHKYVYPTNGLSTLWDAMKKQIEAKGGNFYLSCPIKALRCTSSPNKLADIVLNDGTVKQYDGFVSTIPVLSVFNYLNHQGNKVTPAGVINFRSDVLVYLKVQFETAIQGQCFYCYSEKTPITRITNFDNFTPDKKQPFSILLVELWCGKNDYLWNADEDELLTIVSAELNKTNIFKKLKILDQQVKKVSNAFQIPDLDLVENQNSLFRQLSVYDNLFVTGRNASINFNYGMENAIEDGIKIANELLNTFKTQPQMPQV